MDASPGTPPVPSLPGTCVPRCDGDYAKKIAPPERGFAFSYSVVNKRGFYRIMDNKVPQRIDQFPGIWI